MNKLDMNVQLALRVLAATLMLMPAVTACDAGHAAGDRNTGSLLARQWCSGCHIVDASGQGSDAAPSFQRIARDRNEDQAWLKAWLVSPHPSMPNMNLSREEIDDVVAYLSSLAKP